MKKIISITLLTVITIAFLNAQVYTGINSKIALPTGNYVEINNGIGVDLLNNSAFIELYISEFESLNEFPHLSNPQT